MSPLPSLLLAQLPVALLAFVLFLVLIGPVAALMRRLGWVDKPSHRKRHRGVVPLAGGAGLVVSMLVLAGMLGLMPGVFGTQVDALSALAAPWAIGLFGGAALIFVVAFTDDRTPIRARYRFMAQGAVGLLAVLAGGTMLSQLGPLLWPTKIALPLLIAVPFTVFGLCGIINAVNMSDGADGLAGGLAFVAMAWFALVLALIASQAPASGAEALVPVVFALAGALAGFLLLNLRTPWRSRAAIFMGDGGSMMLGFILGWLAVRSTNAFGTAGLAPVAALWILAVPLFDTLSCMLRRIGDGITPMSPDHRHLHHLLQSMGMSVRRAVASILAAATLLGGLGVAGWQLGLPDWLMFWSLIALFAAYHITALRWWATQPPDPLAPLPEHRRYPWRELSNRLGGLRRHAQKDTGAAPARFETAERGRSS